ncbi:MAG TPA: Na(+)/H(+) antiporter subunit B [Candidatus Mcinerneyibacterium sp.]|nr:Na(+)/H(+) antiporter subunit B [Candidatus Mcinerneyibacterium sp.]
MRKFGALIIILALLYFLGSGLITDLKINRKNNLSQKTARAYINRNVKNPEINNQQLHGKTNNENTAANSVTAVIVDYRSMDTLGEITVLFLAVTGVLALLGSSKNNRIKLEKPNYILKISSKFLFPLIFLFGFYIFIHGHLTPGGGFQGGTIVAAAVLMMYFASNNYRVNTTDIKILESLSGLSFIIIGIFGLFILGDFLQNFLNKGIMGELFSAGIVPIIYILIGLKVSAELSNIVKEFMGDK